MVAEVVTGHALWVLVAVAGVVPGLMVYFAPPARVDRSGWQADHRLTRRLVSAMGACRVVEYTAMVLLLALALGVGWQETSVGAGKPWLAVALVWVVTVWTFLRVGRYWMTTVLRRIWKERLAWAAQQREQRMKRPGLVRPPARVPVHVTDDGAPGAGLVRPPLREVLHPDR